MNNELLLIFTRNPELGKVKTRLAASIGAEAALEIYEFLLKHTHEITKGLEITKQVYYSETIWEEDIWASSEFHKKLQSGDYLGARMKNAFEAGFIEGFSKIVIIGSDIYDISDEDIRNAFSALDNQQVVIGEAQDGGYYLLGMNRLHPKLFENKQWGTNTVFSDTLADLEDQTVFFLPMRNDIDLYEDLLDHEVFNPYTKANEVNNQ